MIKLEKNTYKTVPENKLDFVVFAVAPGLLHAVDDVVVVAVVVETTLSFFS